MGIHDDNRLPDELQDVAARLRELRQEPSALELDRIKTRAMARSRASRTKGSVMKHRLIVAVCSLGLMAGGTTGVIAAAGGNGNGKGAADSQYRPGKGCGDKNHTHTGPPGNPNAKPCPPTAGPK